MAKSKIEVPTPQGTITMLPVDSLYPHKDNPRKDVGDVSELAESLKANGVLQNLTVVPSEISGQYIVIIGHRRLAAAKLAGLEKVPCAIVEMTYEEQIATMLTENMQRTDLTVYEQAKAFQQLSIDLGMSTGEIAEMSGFSETTVKRRTKLAELDEKAFKAACGRGATLFDFAELDKVESPEDKQKCLEAIGTQNFKNVLRSTLDDQKTRAKMAKWVEQLEEFATRADASEWSNGNQTCTVGDEKIAVQYVKNYGSWSGNTDVVKPDDADTVKYYFLPKSMQIDVYKEKVKDDKADAEALERQKRRDEDDAKWAHAQEIVARHKELRRDFIVNYSACKTHSAEIIKACARAMLYKGENTSYYSGLDKEEVCKMLGISYKNDNGYWHADIGEFNQLKAEQPEWVLLIMTYWYLDSCGSYISHDWNSTIQRYVINYRDNQQLDDLYYFLEELGYERSDEERQFSRGTHNLFYVPEETEDGSD